MSPAIDVWFVGAGPGAQDLLTVRAYKLLASADVVLYDSLGTSDLLSICTSARLIAVGKRAGHASTEQAYINSQLVDAAKSGQRVIRLKGGDPTIFGRLDEEMDALTEAGFRYEIVPGITAASAAAAAAGVSLTRRGVARSVTLCTPAVQRGAPADASWLADCDPKRTSAVYMSGRRLAQTASALMSRGYVSRSPVVIAWSVSTPDQRLERTTLLALSLSGQLTAGTSDAGPCVMLVGAACSAREERGAIARALRHATPALRHAIPLAPQLVRVSADST